MAVYRVQRTRDYTVMSNYHLKDKGLTLKSKGLLSMILSLPEEWNYTTRGLASICKEGVDAIGSALKELETAGYIVRRQLRGANGRITDTEYIIYEQPQPKKEVVAVQPMKQDIFFALNSARIQDDQKPKIDRLAEYLQKNPSAKVQVTGYADVNTGNARINKVLSEKRAVNVADALKARGISTDRILVDSKGDTVQPYKTPEENRVSICIAE